MYNKIAKWKIKKATRTSDIETKFIKYANPVISKFVSDLFNFCLKEGVYPDSLKVTEVIPIFKKGEQGKTTNYRSISLLSQINQIFEKLLCSQIYSYLVRYDLLSDCQFGFRKNSSTNFAINKIYNEILSNIDQSLFTCCVFLDLSKTFDKVNHSFLRQKLEIMFGFRGSALRLMESYRTNRYQCTKIGDSKSRKQFIDCGVPQGSSLGPLLFLLYVNDLTQMSQLSTTLFADDTLLLLSDANLSRLENSISLNGYSQYAIYCNGQYAIAVYRLIVKSKQIDIKLFKNNVLIFQ